MRAKLGCGNLLLLIALLLGLAAAAVVLSVQTWGWRAIIALLLVIALFSAFARYAFRYALLTPFRMKGAVLHGARLELHSADYLGAEIDQDADGGISQRTFRYSLDLTIDPPTQLSGFHHWEPSELLVVRSDARLSKTGDPGADVIGDTEQVEIWADGGWQPDDPGKYEGPMRIRLQMRLYEPQEKVGLRYYFTDLGTLDLT